jgi:tRNA pseudouridine55 synthase
VENLQSLPKTYRTVIRLGARSDTLDADGRIEFQTAPRVPSMPEIAEALVALAGEQIQRPPAYSAVKIKGRRAYDLARAGQAFELGARPVRIDRIAAIRYEWPHLELEIDCGGGTYIRSIARDLGESLGCGGFVEALVRTRTGPFALEHAIDPEALASASVAGHLRPALEAVPDLPRLELDRHQVGAVAQGRRLAARDLCELPIAHGPIALVDAEGTLVALGLLDREQGWLQPRKVLI